MFHVRSSLSEGSAWLQWMDEVEVNNLGFSKLFLQIINGSPVAKNLPSNSGDVALIPGQETKIPYPTLRATKLACCTY